MFSKRLTNLTAVAIAMAIGATSSFALSLEDAVLFVLETNPEITSAESSKQAIEFELDQSRSLFAPRFDLEGRIGTAINNGTSTTDLSSADDALPGYEVRGRLSQRLYDGKSTRSEIERQAYRVDAAALRVFERAEFLGLEAIRTYEDVLARQEMVTLARTNLNYHNAVKSRMDQALAEGVVGVGDIQQASERVFLAEDIVFQLELDLEDARAVFLQVVGVKPDNLARVPDVGAKIPGNIDTVLSSARRANPSIRFLQADVGASEALSRGVNGGRYPTIDLEADARYGEDVDSFEGAVRQARVGVVMRYTYQGNFKNAERQEHVRRVSEARANLLTQTRIVEREARQTWARLNSVRRRMPIIEAQASLAKELRASYEAEFEIGNRTLLDVLNTQNALLQAEIELVNSRAMERFAEYRLLATMGRLLNTLGVQPPEDSTSFAANEVGAPGVNESEDADRFDAKTFRQWRETQK